MKKTAIFLIIYLFLVSFSFSQSGSWTWMHGSNLPNQVGNYGVKGVPSILNVPPEASYEGSEWTDLNGNFWCYGGTDLSFNGAASAMWKYDPVINMWTWMSGSNTLGNPPVHGVKGVPSSLNSPGDARQYGACTWVDLQGNLWLFGGTKPGGISYSDLWKYNITTNEWTWMNGPNTPTNAGVYGAMGVSSANNYPKGRYECNASWVDNTGNLWLFGGQANCNGVNEGLNDLWKYDISSNEWTWVRGANYCNPIGNYGTIGVPSPTNEPPATQLNYLKWKDKNGDFWCMGGDIKATTYNLYNELWKYNIASNQWTCIRSANTAPLNSNPCVSNKNNQPIGRAEARTCWVDDCGNFWLFGGSGSFQIGQLNDLWCYNPQKDEWVLVRGNANASFGAKGVSNITNNPPKLSGALPYKHKDGSLWFFGGVISASMGAFNSYNSMWRYVIDTNCVGGCASIQPPVANFTASNLSGCASLTVNFTDNSSGATSWYWTFGDGGTSTLQNPAHIYINSGQYTVTLIATNANGSNTITYTNYITVFSSSIATVTSNGNSTHGDSVQLNVSGGMGYNWFPSTGLSCIMCANPAAKPLETTTYCVEVTNNSGCKDTACVNVTAEIPCLNNIEVLTVPNAFSPNTDNVNDEFCLQGWNYCVDDFTIKIYSRWGEEVFYSKDPDFCWDGNYKGKLMDSQVLVYHIIATYSNLDMPIEKTGNISLIR